MRAGKRQSEPEISVESCIEAGTDYQAGFDDGHSGNHRKENASLAYVSGFTDGLAVGGPVDEDDENHGE